MPLLFVMPLSFFLVFGDSLSPELYWAFGGIMAFTFLTLGPVLFLTGKRVRKNLDSIRLGVSQAGLHFVAPPGSFPVKVAEGGPVPWRDVYFDGRRLLAGKQIILAKLPQGQEVFGRDEFEREILARIPKANFVNTASLGLHHFKAMPVSAKIVNAIGLVIALALLVATVLRK